jgi:hypothetical protein
LETALPSRSSVTSFVVVTAMVLAAICATPATPVPTRPFASRLAELHATFEIVRLQHELGVLQRQIVVLQHQIDANPRID